MGCPLGNGIPFPCRTLRIHRRKRLDRRIFALQKPSRRIASGQSQRVRLIHERARVFRAQPLGFFPRCFFRPRVGQGALFRDMLNLLHGVGCFPIQHPMKNTMHRQIRVSTQRTGEVRVMLVGQAKMTRQGHLVRGRAHRGQNGISNTQVLPVGSGPGRQLHQEGGCWLRRNRAHAQRFQIGSRCFPGLLFRALVVPIQRRNVAGNEPSRHPRVGAQHGFFNHPVRNMPGLKLNRHRLALGIQSERVVAAANRLRTARYAFLQQRFVQRVQRRNGVPYRLRDGVHLPTNKGRNAIVGQFCS